MERVELWQTLQSRLGEVLDISAAIALMSWDQEVYMPPKGAPARGRQLATLSAISHRMFTHPEVGGWIKALQGMTPHAPDEAALLREAEHDYNVQTRFPESFVQEMAEATSQAFAAWTHAREASDFQAFLPYLEKNIELSRRKADYLGYEDSPYNALLDEYERGTTVAQLERLFAGLVPRQTALVDKIARVARPEPDWLRRSWDPDAQWAFGIRVIKDLGYDLEAGRQDKSPHPFTTNFDLYDVRITTRVSPELLFSSLMSSVHETGHALYEQGFLPSDQRTWLGQAPSLGIHESQSRLWENIVGRSLPFWRHYTPILQEYFPGALDAVSPEDVYAALNRVERSLIRVEADECTYNLHIVLRFEIERALIEGTLAPRDVPEAWNAKMKTMLGLDVPNDAQGCLQDIHWAHAGFGYFPSYALGNLYASQLFAKIREDLPAIEDAIAGGEFDALLNWLRDHVHHVGRRRMAAEIVTDATGQPPTPEPYLTYLETKYGALYGV